MDPVCAHQTAAAAIFTDPPHRDCHNRPFFVIAGSGDREDAYACRIHLTWLINELIYAGPLRIDHYAPDTTLCSVCGGDGEHDWEVHNGELSAARRRFLSGEDE